MLKEHRLLLRASTGVYLSVGNKCVVAKTVQDKPKMCVYKSNWNVESKFRLTPFSTPIGILAKRHQTEQTFRIKGHYGAVGGVSVGIISSNASSIHTIGLSCTVWPSYIGISLIQKHYHENMWTLFLPCL